MENPGMFLLLPLWPNKFKILEVLFLFFLEPLPFYQKVVIGSVSGKLCSYKLKWIVLLLISCDNFFVLLVWKQKRALELKLYEISLLGFLGGIVGNPADMVNVRYVPKSDKGNVCHLTQFWVLFNQLMVS